MIAPIRIASILLRSTALVVLWGVALTGCQTRPASVPPAPPPTLQLIGSAPLSLPANCDASGSFFVSFTVLEDGRTGAIKAPQSSSCVAEALSAWVASFRYTPPSQRVETGVEWMLVSARRGS